MAKSKIDKKDFLISVVVPVYNVEKYLDECIQSVIDQTIGFKENIELILVNDGSSDNSGEICIKYRDLYPNNVVYINKKNGGVSSARNKGLDCARGEIINFLDSDDKWEKDAFLKAYKMLKDNKEVNIIATRIKFFDANDNYHALDYKFDEDKVVDVSKDYNHIQLSSSSCFIRNSAIGDTRYDTRLKYSEDMKFVSEILLQNQKLGILSSSLYLYRRRFDETSAIQTKSSNESWYIDTPKLCYKYLFDLSIKKYGYVIPYIQYCVMYDYQWRVKDDIPVNISKNVINEYIKVSKDLLKYIDVEIVLEQKKLSVDYKSLILKEKLGREYNKHLNVKNGMLYFDDIQFFGISTKHSLRISTLTISNNQVILNGMINSILDKSDYDIFIKVNGKERVVKLFDINIHVRKSFNKVIYSNLGFKEIIDISNETNIEMYIRYKGKDYKLFPTFSLFAKINDKIPVHYVENGYSVICRNGVISFFKSNGYNYFCNEFKLLLRLLKAFKIKPLFIRVVYHIFKVFKRKPIWLISDRVFVANDNGLHLFKYAVSHNKNDSIYFVLDKKSDDYNKIKKIGKVINYRSFKYKIYFLLSKYVISSHADLWVYNPFGKAVKYYSDLYNFKLVFLQHGIIKDDLSNWLNIYSKDFDMFVTSAKAEYESIINNKNYHYGPDVIKLTGLPRYDNLNSDPIKQIAIMPTWRKSAASVLNSNDGTREYSEKFKNTDYFTFYNKLINDDKLLNVMKKKGYSGIFVVHPSHVANSIDFQGNDVFDVANGFVDYQKIFRESNLLVSDYSSVPFDFAYMKKPVIYTQFDKKEFFGSHTYTEGYFSYDQDGFGPVCYDYDSSVDAIIKYIENDCVMEDKYKNRVDHFFCYTDKNNCKRVYEEILKLSDNPKKTKK